MLVIALVSALLLSAFHAQRLQQQSQQQLDNHLDLAITQSQSLFDQLTLKLTQTGNFFEKKSLLADTESSDESTLFDHQALDYLSQQQIEFAMVYRPGNQQFDVVYADSPQQYSNFNFKSTLLNIFNPAQTSPSDSPQLVCDQQCSVFYAVPLFSNDIMEYLVLSQSLDHLLQLGQQLTGLPTGILLPTLKPETSTETTDYRWGYSVYSLTNTPWIKPLLNDYALHNDFLKSNAVYDSTYAQHDYSLFVIEIPFSEQGSLVLVSDRTAEVNALFYESLLFWVLSTLFVLLLLYAQRLLQWLPESSNNPKPVESHSVEDDQDIEKTELNTVFEFESINESPVQPPSDNHGFATEDASQPADPQPLNLEDDTEISFLDSDSEQTETKTKNASSNQLGDKILEKFDLLKKYNEDLSQQLAKQTVLLQNKTHQTDNLLNNDEAFVMILDGRGKIQRANSLFCSALKCDVTDLLGSEFTEYYAKNTKNVVSDQQQLEALFDGNLSYYRHETAFAAADGKLRKILWLHSRLQALPSEDRAILTIGMDITHQQSTHDNINWLLQNDALTKLFNRNRLKQELKHSVLWTQKMQANACLLDIDLDHFHEINTSGGHELGDLMLKKTAEVLKTVTASYKQQSHPIVARLGSDEFAVLVRNTEPNDALKLAQDILEAIAGISHIQKNQQLNLSARIGLALFGHKAIKSPQTIMVEAQHARMIAKQSNRRKIIIYNESLDAKNQSDHRLLWRQRIENALTHNRFVLHFQPILNIKERSISHYETLVRMLDEHDKLIPPIEFLQVARELKLLKQIDDYILQTACTKLGQLHREGHEVSLSINLSAQILEDRQLASRIEALLLQHDAPADQLILELCGIDQTVNHETLYQTMSGILALGCHFALDNFGASNSTLKSLKDLPFDYLKIDGSFINDLPNNADNELVVQALSQMAIGFNKYTVAEFVDSPQTLKMLHDAKVTFAQGYYIGRPSDRIPVSFPPVHDPESRPTLH